MTWLVLESLMQVYTERELVRHSEIKGIPFEEEKSTKKQHFRQSFYIIPLTFHRAAQVIQPVAVASLLESTERPQWKWNLDSRESAAIWRYHSCSISDNERYIQGVGPCKKSYGCCRQQRWRTELHKPFDIKQRCRHSCLTYSVSVIVWANISSQRLHFFFSGIAIFFWSWTEYVLNYTVSRNHGTVSWMW